MARVGSGVDALGLYLSGGASNTDPDDSLGGVASSALIRGMSGILTAPIPGLRIDHIWPLNGEGEGTLEIDDDDKLIWTPPSHSPSRGYTIAEGAETVIAASTHYAMKVYREADLNWKGESSIDLVYAMNGAIAGANVTDAQRQAGVVTYRAIMLKAHGDYGIPQTQIWIPAVAGSQATFAVGLETPVGDTIQTIANELAAPSAVSFSEPTTGSRLIVPTIDVGGYMGLWIRRTFPSSGTVNIQEDVQLTICHLGAL